MARVAWAEPIYEAADLFRQRVMVDGTSFLWPDHEAWSVQNIDALLKVLGSNTSYGVTAFYSQLHEQLSNETDGVLRVAADATAFYLLFPNSHDFGSNAKMNGVNRIIEWRPTELALPAASHDLLKAVFADGIGETSTWYQSGRSRHLTLLLTFAREIIGNESGLSDAERYRQVLQRLVDRDVPDSPVRPAALHLLFPDRFEAVIHATSRKAIVTAFSGWTDDATNQDAALANIRRHLIDQGAPADFQFFDPEIQELWVPMTPPKEETDATIRRRYWKISPGEGAHRWSMFRQEDVIAVNWTKAGDLGQLPQQSLEDFKKALGSIPAFAESGPNGIASAAKQLWYFEHEMQIGDHVLAYGNSSVLGWAVVQGQYAYRQSYDEYPHQRAVAWQPFTTILTSTLSPDLANKLKHLTTLKELTQEEFEEATVQSPPPIVQPPVSGPTIPDLAAATYMDTAELDDLIDLLQDKKQLILEGPPGSGKTWLADKLARYLTRNPFDGNPNEQVELVQFHQSYGYEDFVQGIRPITDADGRLTYRVVPGIFTRFCRTAASNLDKSFVLIIDEINRGNLSRIFGELLLLLEYRDRRVRLPYGTEGASDADAFLMIPPNLVVIGTMNSTDRSLAQIDYALRRRFYFHRLLPMDRKGQAPVLGNWLAAQPFTQPDRERLHGLFVALNSAIQRHLTVDFQVGHSYFMRPDIDTDAGLRRVWDRAVWPLLEEYFHGSRNGDTVLAEFRLDALMPTPPVPTPVTVAAPEPKQ